MILDSKTISTLAQLAKMQLSPEEAQKIQNELSGILEFVDTLNTLNTEDVPPTNQVTGLQDVVRTDEPNYTFSKEDMLPTMPDVNDEGYLRVHAVFTVDSPSH